MATTVSHSRRRPARRRAMHPSRRPGAASRCVRRKILARAVTHAANEMAGGVETWALAPLPASRRCPRRCPRPRPRHRTRPPARTTRSARQLKQVPPQIGHRKCTCAMRRRRWCRRHRPRARYRARPCGWRSWGRAAPSSSRCTQPVTAGAARHRAPPGKLANNPSARMQGVADSRRHRHARGLRLRRRCRWHRDRHRRCRSRRDRHRRGR